MSSVRTFRLFFFKSMQLSKVKIKENKLSHFHVSDIICSKNIGLGGLQGGVCKKEKRNYEINV